ncbi:MAG: TetR/AcrR family transcriptional regulator [Actinomycetota bacterium]|nr:TetR/AcrR family transcriptional regulator [Actinomycetota bacterium]
MGRKPIKELRRREIMEALYRCLLDKPFSVTTIKDIGREAGLNPPMLHYYFESKEDVLLNLVDHIYGEHRARFDRHLRKARAEGLDPMELMRSVFGFLNEDLTLDKKLQKVFFEIWEVALHNREVNARVKMVYSEWAERLAELMRQAGGDREDIADLALAAVAFQEGVGIFSVFFGFKKDYTRSLLLGFQERILETL